MPNTIIIQLRTNYISDYKLLSWNLNAKYHNNEWILEIGKAPEIYIGIYSIV